MLPKTSRLNLSKSFKSVASGKRFEKPLFKGFYKYSESPLPLVGIALSKGNFKKAHDRNRAKRLTSQALQELYSSLPKGINLVIMPKQVILESSAEEIKQELGDTIQNLK
jgi:ribonuclease P protein component